MKCFIYRNLHKEGCVYSIKALEGEFKGRIIGYAAGIIMDDCTFKVSVAGRDRVRREKAKNVHAGIVGEVLLVSKYEQRLAPINELKYFPKWFSPMVAITYNPYINDTFVTKKDGQPVFTAAHVLIGGKAVGASRINRPLA